MSESHDMLATQMGYCIPTLRDFSLYLLDVKYNFGFRETILAKSYPSTFALVTCGSEIIVNFSSGSIFELMKVHNSGNRFLQVLEDGSEDFVVVVGFGWH